MAGRRSPIPVFHPASLLLTWAAAVVALQQMALRETVAAALALAPLACFLGRLRFARILRRTRWLLLSLIVLFLWMTPGVYPGPEWVALRITREGAELAAEHALRLVSILAMLSILLDRLDHKGLVEGLYLLMAPFALFGVDRRRVTVRLMLTLEYAAEGHRGSWREMFLAEGLPDSTDRLSLPLPRWRPVDTVVVAGLCAAAVWTMR